MSSTGRRRENEDRRIIDRVSSPLMRMHLGQLRWCLLGMFIFFGGTSVYNLIKSITESSKAYGIIFSLSFFIIAFIVWRYYAAVLLFLQNESASNLDRMLERQSIVWIAAVFFSVIFSIFYFIFN